MSDIIEEIVDSFETTLEEEIVNEETGEKKIGFRGILSEADKINGNKRIYPKSVLRSVFTEAMEESKKTGKPIIGELEHPAGPKVNLDRIAVTFPEFTWSEEKGQILGKAVPTLTEAGKVVEGLAKSGIPICFSTRMRGKVRALTEDEKQRYGVMNEENCSIVCDGASLVSVDVVYNPSCNKAIMNTVYEEKEEALKEEKKLPTFKQVFDAMF